MTVLGPPRVPFTRPLYGPHHKDGPTVGRDVIAVKRALSRAGYLPWKKFTATWSVGPSNALVRFQREHGLPATGNYGQGAHATLVKTRAKHKPDEWAFDAYSAQIMRQWEPPHPPPTPRELVVDLALWTYDIRDLIAYSQTRPIYPIAHDLKPPLNPRYLDCSGHLKYCYWFALGRDLDGLNAYGNTDTLILHGRHVDISDVRPGDAIFYDGHVTLVISNNGAGYIRVVSHGQSAGPLILPHNYRTDFVGARDYIGG